MIIARREQRSSELRPLNDTHLGGNLDRIWQDRSHAEEKAEAISRRGSGKSHGSRTNRDATGFASAPRPQKDEEREAQADIRKFIG
jgi:hypothetical protein